MTLSNHWGLIGHQTAVNFLQQAVTSERLSHAYLITGPEHVGRGTIVDKFCASLFCENHDACGQCRACQSLAKGLNPDVYYIEPQIDKQDIGVERIRLLNEQLHRGSFLNSWKVAIIKEAWRLNLPAANALLKNLEEPQTKVIIILLAHRPDQLPLTISSRCQKINLQLVSLLEIEKSLIQQGSDRLLAHQLAQVSRGLPGLAKTFFHQPEIFLAYKNTAQDFTDFLSQLTATSAWRLVGNLTAEKKTAADWQNILDIWATVLHDLLIIDIFKSNLDNLLINDWQQEKLLAVSQKLVGAKSLAEILNYHYQTVGLLKNNVNPQLAVENLLLNIITSYVVAK